MALNQKLAGPQVLTHNPAGVGNADIKDPNTPLKVLLGPVNLNPQDEIELFWGNIPEPVSHYTHPIDAPEQDIFVTLDVETRWIRSEQQPVAVHYRYIPFPGGAPQDSDITHIRVKLEIPGGVDIDPSTPYQNEALSVPQVQPIGVIVSPQGVSVNVAPYLNMSVGDQVSVAWGDGKVDYPPLGEEQLNRNLVIAIPAQVVEAVGSSTELPVRYEIHDVVGNWSKHSPPTRVVVSLD